jgi:hypothetical protein
MRCLAAGAFACVLVLGAAVRAEQPTWQPTCRAEAKAKSLTGAALRAYVARCEKARAACDAGAKPSMGPRRSGGITGSDEGALDRAMRRNILQSIEEELRRKK